jgi:protein-disulfide isomerase
MRRDWRIIAASSIAGALLALLVIFEFGAEGLLPLDKAATEKTVHDYLVAHPGILVDMTNNLQAEQEKKTEDDRQKAADKLGSKAFFDPKLAFITGPANAKTTVVEFFDYNCPFCRASVPALQKFYDKHKNDTRFAFIEFPIKGQESVAAAHAAIAARKQPGKYVAFHFALMNEKGYVDETTVFDVAKKTGLDIAKLTADMKDPSIDSEIDAAHKLADAAKIDGTPAFIINGKMREGALDDKLLAQMVKS